MAMIRSTNQGVEMVLQANHIIGRHPSTSHLVLQDPKASRMHATISWNGIDWIIHDNSTNGTFVNGIKMKSKSVSKLKAGDEIGFVTAGGNLWQVLNTSAPSSMLMPESSGAPLVILDSIAVLPNEESPEIALYQNPNGDWFCESEQGTWQLLDGVKVEAGEHIWRFVEGRSCDETLESNNRRQFDYDDIGIEFTVSQNEEHVSLVIRVDGNEYDLGERNHHYLLLLLARKYLEDVDEQYTQSEQGWIDKHELERMLLQSEVYINMLIYRFRKQYEQILPEDVVLPQLVERRKGEVRFISRNIKITGGIS